MNGSVESSRCDVLLGFESTVEQRDRASGIQRRWLGFGEGRTVRDGRGQASSNDEASVDGDGSSGWMRW